MAGSMEPGQLIVGLPTPAAALVVQFLGADGRRSLFSSCHLGRCLVLTHHRGWVKLSPRLAAKSSAACRAADLLASEEGSLRLSLQGEMTTPGMPSMALQLLERLVDMDDRGDVDVQGLKVERWFDTSDLHYLSSHHALFPSLHSLSLTHIWVHPNFFTSLAQHCTRLQHLALTCIHPGADPWQPRSRSGAHYRQAELQPLVTALPSSCQRVEVRGMDLRMFSLPLRRCITHLEHYCRWT